jgi:hypothetical protein
MKKNKLMMLTIIISFSASQHAIPGYESPRIEDEIEQRGFIDDAARTYREEELEHRDLINDAARTNFEQELEQRDYINDAGRTSAEERREQTESYY